MTQTTTRTRLPRRGALALVLSVAGAAAFGVSRMKRARPSPAAELLMRDRPVAVGCSRALDIGLSEKALIRTWEAVRLPSQPSWPQLLHAVRLWGDCPFNPQEPWSRHRVIEVLCDTSQAVEAFGRDNLIEVTAYGLRVRWAGTAQRGRPRRMGDAHPDQTVCMLALQGVSPNVPVLVRGQRFAVADLVRYTAANCSTGHELPWTAVSLALYLPSGTVWTNKFGQSCDLDAICRTLASVPLGTGACQGTHTLYALGVLVCVDDQEPFLSGGARGAALERMEQASRALARTQRRDGGWGVDWTGTRGDHGPGASEPNRLIDRISITGHLLEWLAVVPPSIPVGPDQIGAACGFLAALVPALSLADIENAFSELSHAASALKLWNPNAWRAWTAKRKLAVTAPSVRRPMS